MSTATIQSTNDKTTGLLIATIFATVLSLVYFGWWNIQHLQRTLPAQNQIINANAIRSDIQYLDEVLTMSAFMACQTSDPKWENRYREFEPQLTFAITQAIYLAPEYEAIQASKQIGAANNILVKLENQAFALNRDSRRVEAIAILDSEQYIKHKQLYANGLAQLDQALQSVIEKTQTEQRYFTLADALAIAGIVTLLVFIWVLVARVNYRWKTSLVQANKNLQAQTDVLDKQRTNAESLLNEANIAKEQALTNGAQLVQKNQEMERFAYTVSHDLKNPLVTIIGYATMLRKLYAEATISEISNATERIESAAKRMHNSINDLLELSRIGHVALQPTEINVNTLLKDLLNDLGETVRLHDTQIHIQPNLPPITADPDRIREVFDNLICNALKYNTAQDKTTIEIGGYIEGNNILFFVKDNGPGIDEKYHHKIFGLFQRLENETEGTGVGLAIVKRITELHNGAVWVESPITSPRLGVHAKGTAFWLSFPMKTSRTVPPPALAMVQ